MISFDNANLKEGNTARHLPTDIEDTAWKPAGEGTLLIRFCTDMKVFQYA